MQAQAKAQVTQMSLGASVDYMQVIRHIDIPELFGSSARDRYAR